MSKTQILLRLDETLLEAIEAKANEAGVTKQQWLINLARQALGLPSQSVSTTISNDIDALEEKLLASLTAKVEAKEAEYQAKMIELVQDAITNQLEQQSLELEAKVDEMVQEAIEVQLKRRAQAQAAKEAEYQAQVERQIAEMALEEKPTKAKRGAAKTKTLASLPQYVLDQLETITDKTFLGTSEVIALLHSQKVGHTEIANYLEKNQYQAKRGGTKWKNVQVTRVVEGLAK